MSEGVFTEVGSWGGIVGLYEGCCGPVVMGIREWVWGGGYELNHDNSIFLLLPFLLELFVALGGWYGTVLE